VQAIPDLGGVLRYALGSRFNGGRSLL